MNHWKKSAVFEHAEYRWYARNVVQARHTYRPGYLMPLAKGTYRRVARGHYVLEFLYRGTRVATAYASNERMARTMVREIVVDMAYWGHHNAAMTETWVRSRAYIIKEGMKNG